MVSKAAVRTLQEIFSYMDKEVLELILDDCEGNLNRAVEVVSVVSPPCYSSEMPVQPPPTAERTVTPSTRQSTDIDHGEADLLNDLQKILLPHNPLKLPDALTSDQTIQQDNNSQVAPVPQAYASDWSMWQEVVEAPDVTSWTDNRPFAQITTKLTQKDGGQTIANGCISDNHGQYAADEKNDHHRFNMENEEDVLRSLIDAFPDIDLEELASAFVQARKDPYLTVELITSKLSVSPKRDSDVSQIGAAEIVENHNAVDSQNRLGEGSAVEEASKCFVSHTSGSNSRAKKPEPQTGREHKVEGSCSRQAGGGKVRKLKGTSTTSHQHARRDYAEAIDFICMMFGDGLELGVDVVQDVLESCTGDVNKAVEELLKLVGDEEKLADPSTRDEGDGSGDGLATLIKAFPGLEPEQIVMTFQEHNENIQEAAAALLGSSASYSTRTGTMVAFSEDGNDPVWKANEGRLQNAFPSLNREVLQNVLKAANNSFSEACEMLTESGLQPVGLHPGGSQPLPSVWGQFTVPGSPPKQIHLSPNQRISSAGGSQVWQNESEELFNDRNGNRQGAYGSSRRPGFAEGAEQPTWGNQNQAAGQTVYKRERQEAQGLANMRNKYFSQASVEYKRGNRGYAASLAEKGREYDRLYREKNAVAATRIARTINKKNQSDITVDLHQLHVEEALEFLKQHLGFLKSPTIRALKVITGQGHHSADGRAKIRPAVIKCLDQQKYSWCPDPSNSGVILVYGEGQSPTHRAPPPPTLASYFS